MSYLTFPRLHFSGLFRANPSTINNEPDNYNPALYSNIEDMENVQLYWCPLGDGEFTFGECLVTRVEYSDGSSAGAAAEDPIVGQLVSAVKHQDYRLDSALVDLDVDQQSVSEIWGLTLQIGGADMYIRGDFAPAAFNSLWRQAIGKDAPGGSASLSAVYQSSLKNISMEGDVSGSRFLSEAASDPTNPLSINFVVNSHNNAPYIFLFTPETFDAMKAAGVDEQVLEKILPLQQLSMYSDTPKGQLPTQEFTLFALKQRLTTQEYNANVDAIMKATPQLYKRATPNEFTWGTVAGTIGASRAGAPDFFVPSRIMTPQTGVKTASFAPFAVSADGLRVTLNLGNSLATELPGKGFAEGSLGELWLVSFADGTITPDDATRLAQIDYAHSQFMSHRAGFFTFQSSSDLGEVPLGLLSVLEQGGETKQEVLLAENPDGWYLRADQYVFRMNPGVATSADEPHGDTASLNIHALKFGKPVADGTRVQLTEKQGGSGLGTPTDALTVTPVDQTVATTNGIARFTLSASDPGNPRTYLIGQLYFKGYRFAEETINDGYNQDPSDFVSIHIYDQEADPEDAIDILAKYGRLYLVMSFLDDQEKVEGIGLRNMIKTLLDRPVSEATHMPVTRDLSAANREKITAWIDSLNAP